MRTHPQLAGRIDLAHEYETMQAALRSSSVQIASIPVRSAWARLQATPVAVERKTSSHVVWNATATSHQLRRFVYRARNQ
jgi:hypothetical protein